MFKMPRGFFDHIEWRHTVSKGLFSDIGSQRNPKRKHCALSSTMYLLMPAKMRCAICKPIDAGARFTNVFFCPQFKFDGNIRLAITPLLDIRSQQIFAHATTAHLSCHVQNFVAITVLESRWEWNKISIEFESISETAPGPSLDPAHK